MSNCLTKIHSKFPFTEKLREYAINPEWQNRTALWDFVSASSEGIGQYLYEHAKNFVQNVRDIDTCGLHELYSIATELDVPNVFSYNLTYPPELEEIMDLLSTNRSYLLTTGYLLDNACLSAIYYTSGEYSSLTGLTTGQVLGGTNPSPSGFLGTGYGGLLIYQDDSIFDYPVFTLLDSIDQHYKTFIPDEVYITGFVEPILRDCLVRNTQYLGHNMYPTIELEKDAFRISEEYKGFLDDITSDPSMEWNASTSAIIIDDAVHKLHNIAIKSSYYREILKDTAQRHAMIGSTRAIEKLISEYVLRTWTKQDDWRLYVEPSGIMKPASVNEAYALEQVLPSITDTNSYFNVRVVEYWDRTDYMNISAESALLCGITGYEPTPYVTADVDISGNLITGIGFYDVPIYAAGENICGYVVTGGQLRFWEGEALEDAIYLSEHTSAEVSGFYCNIGASGVTLDDWWGFQTKLWDMFAVSSFDRPAYYIPELTGQLNDEWNWIPPSGWDIVPASGWITLPTWMGGIHDKYMNSPSGWMPQANVKSTLYPTIAPQPFIWNLVEKVYDDFPTILDTILFTEQTEQKFLEESVDASGNLIDSWKYFNQEYISYQTNYEESINLDYKEDMNPAIDRDGPWDAGALSAYILSANMYPFYEHLNFNFRFEDTYPRIDTQLSAFREDILQLSGGHIYQFAFDQYDNQYSLYKYGKTIVEADEFDVSGEIWMRYRSHPLSFPLVRGTYKDRNIQQLFLRGGMGLDIDHMCQHCYDFGFVNDTMWVLGGIPDDTVQCAVMHNALLEFPLPIGVTQYSTVINNPDIPRILPEFDGDVNKWVGWYSFYDYIIFVFLQEFPENNTIKLKFKHYNKWKRVFENSPIEDVIITDPKIKPAYTQNENVFRLVESDDLITIAYEADNSDLREDWTLRDFDNSIVVIDIIKSTLSTRPGDYIVYDWFQVQEPEPTGLPM